MLVNSSISSLAAEPVVKIEVDASNVLSEGKKQSLLGGNLSLWTTESELRLLKNSPLLKLWNPRILRIPGGSWSDEFYWNGNGVRQGNDFDPSKKGPDGWQVDYSAYAPGFRVFADQRLHDFHGHVDVKRLHEFAKQQNATGMVTVNAGTGTPEMAAEWVRWANLTMGYGVKYWEIGNELEGSWEAGNTRPDGSKMTAKKYAEIYLEFAKAMRAVDPSIKIGGPTNSNDSIVYVEELLKSAGDEVDFVSFHTYPVDPGKTTEDEIFEVSSRLSGPVAKIRSWIERYQPQRKDQIEIGITEWHLQVSEDSRTTDLVSGLWSLRFIGEMMKANIDFANQWDMFSTTKHGGGHGLFQIENDKLIPRAAYHAQLIWSQYLGDTLVASKSSDPQLISYATLREGKPAILLVNQSNHDTKFADLSTVNGLTDAYAHSEFSNKTYLWNPVTEKPEWSSPPLSTPFDKSTAAKLAIPPLSAIIVHPVTASQKWSNTDEAAPANLDLLLPKDVPSDLPFEAIALLRSSQPGRPFVGPDQKIDIKLQGPLKIAQSSVKLSGPSQKLRFTPTGAGPASITISCGELKRTFEVNLTEVKKRNVIVWTFGSDGKDIAASKGNLPVQPNGSARRNQDVIEVTIDNQVPKPGHDRLIEFNPLKLPFDKAAVGGVTMKVRVDPSLAESKGAFLQIILQSENDHWMNIAQIPLKNLPKVKDQPEEWIPLDIEIDDPATLKAMSGLYSIVIQFKSKKPLKGSVYLDDLGFILRR